MSWQIELINRLLRASATFVSDEVEQQRMSVCRGCEHAGEVQVLGRKVDGCTLCGCPFETKLKTKTYIHPTKGRTVTTCPAGKWT